MSLIHEEERVEILECTDSFLMSKMMQGDGFDINPFNHHTKAHNILFFEFLEDMRKKYPYFKVRQALDEEPFFILTISLPHHMKDKYKQVKSDFRKTIENAECYYGEFVVTEHYNELHVEVYHYAFFHDLLKGLLHLVKKMDQKGVVQ